MSGMCGYVREDRCKIKGGGKSERERHERGRAARAHSVTFALIQNFGAHSRNKLGTA